MCHQDLDTPFRSIAFQSLLPIVLQIISQKLLFVALFKTSSQSLLIHKRRQNKLKRIVVIGKSQLHISGCCFLYCDTFVELHRFLNAVKVSCKEHTISPCKALGHINSVGRIVIACYCNDNSVSSLGYHAKKIVQQPHRSNRWIECVEQISCHKDNVNLFLLANSRQFFQESLLFFRSLARIEFFADVKVGSVKYSHRNKILK